MQASGRAVACFRFLQVSAYFNYLKSRFNDRDVSYSAPPVRALQHITLLAIRILFKKEVNYAKINHVGLCVSGCAGSFCSKKLRPW